MSEFSDRMHAQRVLLQVVNSATWPEELFGLSNQAIDRWADRSGISPDAEVLALLRSASEHLSFLANRSQMQVSDEYRRLSQDVRSLTDDIQQAIGRATL